MDRTRTLVIVGGGVLGSAIAFRFLERFAGKVRVIVLEALSAPGLVTSAKSSGVLHAGIHSPLGSLKGRLSYEGHLAARDFAKAHDVPILECGMLIAATYRDLPQLAARAKAFRGVAKNASALKVAHRTLLPWHLKALEPHVHGVGGLFLPSVSSVDGTALSAALLGEALKMGAHAYYGAKVESIALRGNAYWVKIPGSSVRADLLVNAAGLSAGLVAALGGYPDYRVRYVRGEYCEIMGRASSLVNRFVYPVPIEGRTTKGMHFVKRPDGRLFFGCNSREVPSPDYYEEDKTPVEFFRDEALRFVPELRNAEFRWSYSGIRPKLDTAHDADFVFALDRISPPFLNCVGYDSPGLSAAIAVGRHVTDILAPYIV